MIIEMEHPPIGGDGGPSVLRARQPDPEAATLLALYNALAAKPLARVGLDKARRSWRLLASAVARARPVATVESLDIPGPGGAMTLRLYRTASARTTRPAFIWFHGGGFLMGDVDTADTICRHIARASDAVVIAAPYRLVPEHDLYAGRVDAVAAFDWLLANAASVGIDASRLAIGGDSAGGNLAAVVARRCARRHGPPLRLQVLAYPATNLRDDLPSKLENSQGYMLTANSIDWFKAMFSRGEPDLADPWLSPMFEPDLAGQPPAVVVSAGFDPIRDDGIAYAARLREAGVPVELLHYAGQFHGFLNFDGVLRGARDALDRIGAALRGALADEPARAPDRTIEISTRTMPVAPALQPGRTAMMAALMVGERLEQWWGSVIRRLAPTTSLAEAIDRHPLLYPVSACRARLSAFVAPLEATETYRGRTARPAGPRRQGGME
jgi:acetyl esterase